MHAELISVRRCTDCSSLPKEVRFVAVRTGVRRRNNHSSLAKELPFVAERTSVLSQANERSKTGDHYLNKVNF